jgi:hypothetical protein
MAGLSFLYAFFNLYSLGVPGVPTVDEAMVDIDSCMAVLEYLTRELPVLVFEVFDQTLIISSSAIGRSLPRHDAGSIQSHLRPYT